MPCCAPSPMPLMLLPSHLPNWASIIISTCLPCLLHPASSSAHASTADTRTVHGTTCTEMHIAQTLLNLRCTSVHCSTSSHISNSTWVHLLLHGPHTTTPCPTLPCLAPHIAVPHSLHLAVGCTFHCTSQIDLSLASSAQFIEVSSLLCQS